MKKKEDAIATLKICGKTDIGRKRKHNEDSFIINNIIENEEAVYLEIPLVSSFVKNYGLLVAVADGMGGHSAGEVASELALKLLSQQLMSTHKEGIQTDEITKILRNSIISAHDAIYDMSRNIPEYSGMGTTIAGLYFCGDSIYTFHAGDSRIYRMRNGGLFQMTNDHSLVQELVNVGQITKEESYLHTKKNEITNSLGGGDNRCKPEITDQYALWTDDIFLICSDGLSDMLNDTLLAKVLTEDISLRDKTDSLVSLANEHGGEDNITVILITAKGA
jgi:PPM family protein phosphatase